MEGAGAWEAERSCPNQSNTTARPAHRIVSTEWLGLQSPNQLYKHAEVATKNWPLFWTDGGHRRRQNRRMNGQNHSKQYCQSSGAARAAAWLAGGD
jgi:hypothetical protein